MCVFCVPFVLRLWFTIRHIIVLCSVCAPFVRLLWSRRGALDGATFGDFMLVLSLWSACGTWFGLLFVLPMFVHVRFARYARLCFLCGFCAICLCSVCALFVVSCFASFRCVGILCSVLCASCAALGTIKG